MKKQQALEVRGFRLRAFAIFIDFLLALEALHLNTVYCFGTVRLSATTGWLGERGGYVVRPSSFDRFPYLFEGKNQHESNTDEISEIENEEELFSDFITAALPSQIELPLDLDELEQMTVSRLKQQLRLRGMKVSGRKSELVERLLRATGSPVRRMDAGVTTKRNQEAASPAEEQSSRSQQFTQNSGENFVDVETYLEDDDVGKSYKSRQIAGGATNGVMDDEGVDAALGSMNEPEVWGADAKIVEDYEGRKLVVDSLSQTIVEFRGSNRTQVKALVVATREALRPFLAGGIDNNYTKTPAEIRLREIQTRRENEGRRPVRLDDTAGLDEGDETGIYKDILHRDFSDWGKHTVTGAQLSASEVQGVLLLSDVYGAFTDDTKALAEKIAFECQPIVVMVPDLFSGQPWVGPTDGINEHGQSFDQWRAGHHDLQVSVNIRAAALCLRQQYGVSSVVVWGTCYGGGRSLEAAAGWLPDNGNIHDIDGSIGPPPVDPSVAVAWYPTRYNKNELFGPRHKGSVTSATGENRTVAVLCMFAGNDKSKGATRADAAELKGLLNADERVIDHLVKVFPDQNHGFAHIGLSHSSYPSDPTDRFIEEEFGGSGRVQVGNSEAEVACLLSTAFMETYSRVFLPTVGPPISRGESDPDWGAAIEMKDFNNRKRDVRSEINDAMNSFVEEPLGGYRLDPSDESQEDELAMLLRSMQDPSIEDGPYKIQPDDNLATIYAKLASSDDNFQIF